MVGLVSIIFIIVLAGIFIYLKKKGFNDLVKSSFQFSLLLVKIPPEIAKADDKKNIKEKISVAEQFLNAVLNLKKPIVFEIALHHVGEEIYFYLATPKSSEDFVKKQIQGFWSQAFIQKVEDYNIFNPQGKTAVAYLKLKEPWFLPIRTFQELEADPISSVLNSFSQLKQEGEGLAFQIVIRPSSKSLKKVVQDIVKRLRQGNSLSEATGKLSFKDLGKTFVWAMAPKQEKENEKPKPIDETMVKSLESKISRNLFFANLRLLASADTKERAEEILTSTIGSFGQFSSPVKNGFQAVKPARPQKFIFNYSFRAFDASETVILNAEEVASFWHFPVTIESAPYAKWVKAKEAPPTIDLPTDGVLVGKSSFRGEERLVRITPNDRRRHVYMVGQTGTGKSYGMTNMVIQDIKNGAGVGIIDPHGDLIEQILTYIPKERAEDVILFNPGDLERPMGLNMMEYDFNKPEQKTFITNELIYIFDKLYDLKQTGGPMFEYYLRNALGLLMSDTTEIATLLDVPRIFTNEEFREKKLIRCSDPTIVEFWEKEASKVTSGDISIANISPYITSKFNSFISNDYMRPIISQQKSAFDFRDVMDNGKILLVNLSKGRIGDLNASLLGLILVGRILMSALSRVDTPEENRRDFYLYIDEFQNFTTPSIATILAEARKYRLNLTMAHQFIAQLDEKIRDAVFGNVGTTMSFRVGAKDAEFLVKYFEPVFDQNDLINLDNYNALIKLLVNNMTVRPFNIKTIQREKGDQSLANTIRDLSRMKYGKPRAEVEQEIREKFLK